MKSGFSKLDEKENADELIPPANGIIKKTVGYFGFILPRQIMEYFAAPKTETNNVSHLEEDNQNQLNEIVILP